MCRRTSEGSSEWVKSNLKIIGVSSGITAIASVLVMSVAGPGTGNPVPVPTRTIQAPLGHNLLVTPQPRSVTVTATVTATATTTVTPASRYKSYTIWDQLAQCESSGNWADNTGNGFYGGLQFTLSSWRSVGGTGLPSNASREEQIHRAILLQASQGWGAWPVCSKKIGVR